MISEIFLVPVALDWNWESEPDLIYAYTVVVRQGKYCWESYFSVDREAAPWVLDAVRTQNWILDTEEQQDSKLILSRPKNISNPSELIIALEEIYFILHGEEGEQ